MSDATGSCLCGAVRFKVTGPLRPVVYCHCSQCRKTSGHYVAATACAVDDLQLQSDDGLGWFRSSDDASRGFCKTCGSNLFWRPDHKRYISIMAGTLDTPTGLEPVEHIFTADASDYYGFDDGLPKYPGDSPKRGSA